VTAGPGVPGRRRDTASEIPPPPPRLTPALTPRGRLVLVEADDASEIEPALARRLVDAFARGSGEGLLHLGGAEVGVPLPPVFAYWREFGARYITAVCARPGDDTRHTPVPPPGAADLDALALGAPAMPGAEYVGAPVLEALWLEIDAAFEARRASQPGSTTGALLKQLDPAWNAVGRVHFNLAENRRDGAAPFAFLATYTHQLSARGTARHVPLGEALREYAGARNRDRLLSLLLPVQRAAERCPWLRDMVDAGEIFHPLRWTAGEAFRLLADVPELERAGVIVRTPAAWRAGRPPRPRVTATVGSRPPAGLGAGALLDFRVELTLDGERLTPEEVARLLAGAGGLALVRGRWVEVDPERLRRTMEQFREAERLASEAGLTFAEAMRWLAGADVAAAGDADTPDPTWSHAVAGEWLADTLRQLRSPESIEALDPGRELRGTLRPYQDAGVRWLHLLSRLGLGACLADDMGLGKTIQVLALLLLRRREAAGSPDSARPRDAEVDRRNAGRRVPSPESRLPSLLVAPASLVANWQAEIERFAPSLRTVVAHPSVMPAAELKALDARGVADADLVITTYGSLLRLPWLADARWEHVILDEAQAIKNPGAKQTRAAKRLAGRSRIALTGTPVENHLADLWSIFDFVNPGLLGSAKQFGAYVKRLTTATTATTAAAPRNPYGPLRELVRPYILRRLKTDRSVIADLPEKTEVTAYCQLSRKQVALYQKAVRELAEQVAGADGIRRRGVVLAFLLRFKQLCNHPSQWLSDDRWDPGDSGKFDRLRELAEVIAAKQEKVLVFTQFREATAPLAAYLQTVFGRPGVVLHGGTAVGKRAALVRQFQEDELVPFFVISLKAGGSGLNLTAASHVIHFDRWWNPAVENQATDRAFRIGQRRNVLVHKFVCRGTVEEKIDQLIASKTQLSTELLDGGGEIDLTALGDEELMRLVALDLPTAMEE